MFQSTIRRRGARAAVARGVTTLHAMALSVQTWLRGEHVTDDRGSDSSEKALMIILAVALGTAVTIAAVTFVASKTALFK